MLFPPPPLPFLVAIGFYLSTRSIDPVVKLFSTGRMPSAFQPSFLRTCMYICVRDTKERDMEEKVTCEKSKRREHSSPFEIYFFGEEKVATIIRDIIIFQLLITVYVIERLYVISVYKLNNNKIN